MWEKQAPRDPSENGCAFKLGEGGLAASEKKHYKGPGKNTGKGEGKKSADYQYKRGQDPPYESWGESEKKEEQRAEKGLWAFPP